MTANNFNLFGHGGLTNAQAIGGGGLILSGSLDITATSDGNDPTDFDLILNATSLNTGHNWQFTATWMGEPPSGVDPRVDGSERLRRLYYKQAPAPFGDTGGAACAAAS